MEQTHRVAVATGAVVLAGVDLNECSRTATGSSTFIGDVGSAVGPMETSRDMLCGDSTSDMKR